MKTFNQLVKESRETKPTLDIQENTINFIPAEDLKQYLTIVNKFLSEETKEVINYLIVNNEHYVDDMTNGDSKVENALEHFYNNGPYTEEHKKELFKLLVNIIKSGRVMEIPVFQTKEQFEAIISRKVSPDEIILDLVTKRGREIVTERYTKLVELIARQFAQTVNIPEEDLRQTGFIGLIHAMNHYGSKYGKVLKKEQETGIEETSLEQYKKTTFLTYASFAIRNFILDSIKNDAHTVRIPANQQQAERNETGSNKKHTSISGDRSINQDDDGGKTYFDMMHVASDSTNKANNREDIERCWKLLVKTVIDSGEFSNMVIYCWLYSNGIADYVNLTYDNGKDLSELDANEINNIKLEINENPHPTGDEKTTLSNAELSKKFNKTPSNITYYSTIINTFIRKNKRALAIASELNDLYYECKQLNWDEEINEPVKLIFDNTKIDY
jgi:hypothetical protein